MFRATITNQLWQTNAHTDTMRQVLIMRPLPRKMHLKVAPIKVTPLKEHPQHFKCCITLSTMLDPVMAADGHTYDRYAIEK